jgi:hypothetical protein
MDCRHNVALGQFASFICDNPTDLSLLTSYLLARYETVEAIAIVGSLSLHVVDSDPMSDTLQSLLKTLNQVRIEEVLELW